uniref:Uncharacterized protein n=1 Tax=Anopheles coluzzii TaxID=1518534 RepID=A0A8W7P6G5_ANOCL
MKSYVDMEIRKLATMVLLDLTAYHYEQRLNHHPCYKKSAKFVILMGGTSFDRKETALKYLQKYAILNFVLVSVTNSSESVSVYTWNQYTGQENYFRSTDRPTNLRDLNGYRFTMYGITNYPYIMFGPNGTAQGLVPNFLNIVIRKRCNGTTFYTDSAKMHYAMDANFNMQHERFSFKNTFFFWEETGIYLVCPVRSVRDFLRHLLKPFSLGIWLILGGLFALCRVAEILFPNIYRYDLIAITFFGGGGVEYRQPFAFRIVTLTLAVLVFFLSEAYNTKIISLMSFEKFTEQPQTLDAIQQSDLRIMFSRGAVDIFSSLKNNFLSPSATMRAQKRYGHRVYEHYCAMMYKGNAWIAVAPQMMDLMGSLYMVPEPLMIDKMLIQLMQHSPFFDLFERMFGLVNECGVWAYMLNQSNAMLYRSMLLDTLETMLQEIIDDEEVEASFNAASFREHFQHEIDLREMGGMCMLCPVDTGRDFLTHLLKPFSYGIWIVLGAVYLVCRFLQHRYPAIFCYDLTLLTFFGGGGVEYRQAFAFRIALLILAMLLFFLSEAYNTKIISLMSLSKFYERPETMFEFRATDFRIVLETPRPLLLGDLYPKVLSPRETARLRRKLGIRLYRHYCTIIACGDAWLIALSEFEADSFPMYVLREKAIETTQSIQFSINSPIAGTMKHYFGLYCDTGLWQRQKDRHNLILEGLSLMKETFSEVIFYYEDLQRYLSRIIALMSLGRFYKRPNTMAEFKQSGYEFLVHPKQLKAFPLDDFRHMMLSDVQVERNRRVYGMYMHLYYCSMQECSDALLLASPLYQGLAHPFYVLKDKIIPLPYRLQFAKNSPLLATFRRYFGLFYETGLWDFDINRHDVNYAILPTPAKASDLDNNIFLFTQNRYSKEEIAVRLDDLGHLYQLYPDKLANLILTHLIESSDDFDADVYFQMSVQRDHFQHEFYFHQMGGIRYVSKMISLMSLRMFYQLPSTIAEFKASGYKFLVYEDQQQNLPLDDFRFMMLGEDENEDGRA